MRKVNTSEENEEELSHPLDYIRCFREVGLVSLQSRLFEPRATFPACHVPGDSAKIENSIEILPSKCLNTRPNKKPWKNGFDRVCTPLSLEDLGPFRHGPTVNILGLLGDRQRVVLPYHISGAVQALIFVQHHPGYNPMEASFLFVGQRQAVAQIVAVPWCEAIENAETLPEARRLGPVLFVSTLGCIGYRVF